MTPTESTADGSGMGPTVLELRIHGIKNTPPAEMLGVQPGEVRADQADEDGGFYVPTVDPPDPDDPARPPTDIRREGYSWGRLSRLGSGAWLVIGQFFIQLAWLLILPFGLSNTAYWTRRIPDQTGRGRWSSGRGAPALRVFALGLTLLYVCALASVSLSMVGAQCLAGTASCPGLPGWVTEFFALPEFDRRGVRMVVLALVPLAGVLLLFVVSHRGRTRYEAAIFGTVDKIRNARRRINDEKPRRPLSTGGFWDFARVRLPSELYHVAATLFLLSVLIAWDDVFAACADPGDGLVPLRCFELPGSPLAGKWWIALAVPAGLVGLVVVVVRIILDTDSSRALGDASEPERADRALAIDRHRRNVVAGLVLAASALLFGYAGIVVAAPDRSVNYIRTPFIGLILAPSIVLGALVAIAIAALGWRRLTHPGLFTPRAQAQLRLWTWILVPLAGVAILLAVVIVPHGALPGPVSMAFYVLAAVSLGAFLLIVWLAPRRAAERIRQEAGGGETTDAFATEGWSGTGPAVLMMLALGAGILLSTFLVLGTQCWLASTGPVPVCPLNGGDAPIATPQAFANFGGTVPVLAIILVLVVAAVAAARLASTPLLTTPPTRGGRPLILPVARYENGVVQNAGAEDKLAVRILHARRTAGLVHRGEPILGLLAFLLALGIVYTVVLPSSLHAPALDLALPALGLIAVVAVIAIAQNSATAQERPISVMWDLMCFLPRAGHPFAPPCYAERVIPELRDRVVDWLEADIVDQSAIRGGDRRSPEERARDEHTALTTPQRRKVILSAHSLGGVLAVSCIFTLASDTQERLRNVGLLTYGTQLRAYFGRFFPELFGPEALGVFPTRGPSLRARDPWLSQVVMDQQRTPDELPPSGSKPTLRELLTQPDGVTVAWVNLWRRTDYLGFPDFSYGHNRIDRGADEFGPARYLVQIASHPGYQSSAQYMTALRELADRLRA
ncbi:hypothetical protein [Leifsonia sp. AG29]|uniref:hypothetical protein n=1 Tax=Leifsonia sp. AG29 TaxID=2598860 RepID=UPI001E4C9DB5|nr:hypothetical protein [Leifsonia sp. AG29]